MKLKGNTILITGGTSGKAGGEGYVKPFFNSVKKNIAGFRVVYDKFHIMRHLNDALDKVRRHEYYRLAGRDRSFIKGQRYTLLPQRENLTLEGRRALRKLFKANKRLNVAYLLKESLGQLWDYETEGWARRFFETAGGKHSAGSGSIPT